jgi:hypothetical protein
LGDLLDAHPSRHLFSQNGAGDEREVAVERG